MMRTGVRTAPTLSLPSNTLILLMAYFSFVAIPVRVRRTGGKTLNIIKSAFAPDVVGLIYAMQN